MGISIYQEALERLNKQLDKLSNDYKKSKGYFWFDALHCFLFYGATPRNYINYEMYKLKDIERKKFLVNCNFKLNYRPR